MRNICIVGPTASGKSSLALLLAQELRADIVSVDAYQVYRRLDIGTAKPTPSQRDQISHHLIDLVNPTDSFTVADYLQYAQSLLSQPPAETLIWVGGTGLYFRALCQGLSAAPPSDPRMISELEKLSVQQLSSEISQIDPEWAERADLKNPRRVIRALAVYRQTGKPLSYWHTQKTPALLDSPVTFYLRPNLSHLRRKIRHRTQSMWEEGWVEETRQLLQLPKWSESQSSFAIGYQSIIRFINGLMTEEQCLEQISLETGQFAKRQQTWFNSEKGIHTLPLAEKELFDPEKILPKILKTLSDKQPIS